MLMQSYCWVAPVFQESGLVFYSFLGSASSVRGKAAVTGGGQRAWRWHSVGVGAPSPTRSCLDCHPKPVLRVPPPGRATLTIQSRVASSHQSPLGAWPLGDSATLLRKSIKPTCAASPARYTLRPRLSVSSVPAAGAETVGLAPDGRWTVRGHPEFALGSASVA
jgi:hypothetical protein